MVCRGLLQGWAPRYFQLAASEVPSLEALFTLVEEIAPDPVNFTRVLEAALPVVTHHFTKRLFDDCWKRSPNPAVYERRVPDFAATYRPDPLGRTTELRDEPVEKIPRNTFRPFSDR